MNGVRFYGKQWKGQEGKHSSEYGLILAHKEISEPVPQSNFITVPARNGFIDATNALGVVKFNPRTITMRFLSIEKFENWTSKASELQNDLSGIEVGICFDDDDYWVWKGRITTIKPTMVKKSLMLEVKATVDPYKQSYQGTDEDWLWDPFDFDSGVINELYNIQILAGTNKTIRIEGITKPIYPVVLITVGSVNIYKEPGYSTKIYGQGEHRMYNIALTENNPEFTIRALEDTVCSVDVNIGRL